MDNNNSNNIDLVFSPFLKTERGFTESVTEIGKNRLAAKQIGGKIHMTQRYSIHESELIEKDMHEGQNKRQITINKMTEDE